MTCAFLVWKSLSTDAIQFNSHNRQPAVPQSDQFWRLRQGADSRTRLSGSRPDPSEPRILSSACESSITDDRNDLIKRASKPHRFNFHDMKKITVLLADDHRVVREGLRVLVETEGDIEVVGEAKTKRMLNFPPTGSALPIRPIRTLFLKRKPHRGFPGRGG